MYYDTGQVATSTMGNPSRISGEPCLSQWGKQKMEIWCTYCNFHWLRKIWGDALDFHSNDVYLKVHKCLCPTYIIEKVKRVVLLKSSFESASTVLHVQKSVSKEGLQLLF